MKRLVFLVLLAATTAQAQTHVRPHIKRDGTLVEPHMRSNPDNTRLNNWSTQGNVNPYTGRAGTQNPLPNPYPSPYYNPYPGVGSSAVRPVRP